MCLHRCVYPNGPHAHLRSAVHISLSIIPDMNDPIRGDSRLLQCAQKNPRVRLRRTGSGCSDDEVKQVANANPLHIGVTICYRANAIAPAQSPQNFARLCKHLDLIARFPENLESSLHQIATIPALGCQLIEPFFA